MKRPSLINSLELLIFFVLIGGMLLLLPPVSRKLEDGLAQFRDTLSARLEKITGLHFAYSRLSPSIFRSLEFSDLVITDIASDTVIARIADVSVSYDILSVLRGDIQNALTSIVVRNGTISIDQTRNNALIELIRSLVKNENASFISSNTASMRDYSTKSFSVIIRNIDVIYSDLEQTVSVHIAKGIANMESGEIKVTLESSLRYARTDLRGIGDVTTGISIQGSIENNFNSGSASIVIKDFDSTQFSLSRLSMITSYRDGRLELNSMQNLQPIDFKFLWDIPQKTVTASLVCENLLPLRMVRLKNKSPAITELQDMLISGSANLKISGNSLFEYDVKLDGEIPYNMYQGGNVSLDCVGTAKAIDVKEFRLKGMNFDVFFSGSLDIVKKMPEGFLSVTQFTLPSGSTLSGDMYIQPGKNGFSCVIPELYINKEQFSSISLNFVVGLSTIEFTVSAFDEIGHISIDGTYQFGKQSFLQLYSAFDSISVSNLVSVILEILGPGKEINKSNIINALRPFALTTEVYFSTDFSNLSFNCPRLVFASAESDGLYIILSLKGNQTGIDITDISFSHSNMHIAGTIHTEFENSGDVFFNSALTVNSIPYAFSGMYSNRVLTMYGDYKTALSLVLGVEGRITGSITSESLPLPVGNSLLSLSFQATLEYTPETSWKIIFQKGTVEEMTGLFPLQTVLGFQGSLNQTGLFLDSITVEDTVSRLSGFMSVNLLPSAGLGSIYAIDLMLQTTESKESYQCNAQVTLSDDTYFESKITVNEIPLIRFIQGQLPNNRFSGTISCSGTPENIYASVDIDRLLYKISGFDLDARGKIRVENKIVSLSETNASWNGHTFTEVEGAFSIEEKKGTLASAYNSVFGKSGLSAKLGIEFTSEINDQGPQVSTVASLFSRFSIRSTITDINWNSIKPEGPIVCSFIHEPGITTFYAGKNDAITGFFLQDGTVSLQANRDMPVSFYLDGKILNSLIDVKISDFHTDLKKIWPYTTLGIVQFNTGSIDGNFTLTGLLRDPEFNGELRANDILVGAPGYLGEVFGSAGFNIFPEGKNITIPAFTLASKKSAFTLEALFEFDRWLPSKISVKTVTLPGKLPVIDTDNILFTASGFASWDLDAAFTLSSMDLKGIVNFEHGSCAIQLAGLSPQNQTKKSKPFDVKLDLNLSIGKKVEFRFPSDDIPIIRGLIQASQPLNISLDTTKHTFSFKGTANLKGGEIFYIKRSFYLREGGIIFNENQDVFDPLLTFRAEVRERDVEGEPVRITLSVENQPLRTFIPELSSDPPKSEAEILALLGQASIADTSRETIIEDVVVTASDILTQMSVFRNAENKIRDLIGLDVFSIRTLLLQNAILGQTTRAETDTQMSIGNYFDNTTVYIGKYWGSAIYTDALMHFSYYDRQTAENTGSKQNIYGNMLFEPEIGLEVSTPFFFLRWGLNPSNLDTLLIEDNSVTLSWKFSY